MTVARSLRVPRHGDASVLTVERADVPEPGPGQVRVAVRAAGVNFIDVYKREGIYPVPTPFTLGEEGAGVVESVGEGVDRSPGERVAWAMQIGSAAELALLPASRLVTLPDEVDFDTGAAAMLQGMTAHALVNSVYAVQPGDAVLVHAAAGGVGQWLVQLCAAKGATVVATAGSPAKLEKARSLGATPWSTTPRSTTWLLQSGTRTLAPAYTSPTTGSARRPSTRRWRALRRRGMLVLFGASSGPVPPVDPQRLNAGGSLYLTRPTLAHYIAEPDELRWRAGEVLSMLGSGAVSMQIGGRYALDDAADGIPGSAGPRDDRQAHLHALMGAAPLEGRRAPGCPRHREVSRCC